MRTMKEFATDTILSIMRVPFARTVAALNGVTTSNVADFHKNAYGIKTFLRMKYCGVDVEVCYGDTVGPFYLAACLSTVAGAKHALVAFSMRDLRELMSILGEEKFVEFSL